MKPQVVIVSHRRSGTHLLIDTVTQNFPRFAESLPAKQAFFEHFRGPDNASRAQAAREAVRERSNVFFTHVHDLDALPRYFDRDPDVLAWVEEVFAASTVIYVARDGRDSLFSMYEWMRATGDLADSVSFSTFLRQDNEWDAPALDRPYGRAAFWRLHIENWRSRPGVTHLRYEDLLADLPGSLAVLGQALGETVRAAPVDMRRGPLLGRFAFGRWARWVYGRFVEPLKHRRSQAHFFRRGAIGDYRSVFSEADLAVFDEAAGETLRSLGYDSSPRV